MDDLQIENIVVAFSVSSSLDLPTLASVLPDVTYNPDEVPALILQFTKPRCMVSLFATGKAVMTGLKNMDDVAVVIKMVLDRLSIIGLSSQELPEMQIQNVTGSIDLHRSLDLPLLAKSLENIEYTPKSFPALIYKGHDPNTVILLFDSGKIVCNSTSVDTVTVALTKMIETLVSFGINKEEHVCPK